MDVKRTLIGVATAMLAAGTIAAGAVTASSTDVYHDMVNHGLGHNAAVADSTVDAGPDLTVYHDM
jgi:hypothetical protein